MCLDVFAAPGHVMQRFLLACHMCFRSSQLCCRECDVVCAMNDSLWTAAEAAWRAAMGSWKTNCRCQILDGAYNISTSECIFVVRANMNRVPSGACLPGHRFRDYSS